MNVKLSPDDQIFFSQGFIEINATLVYTWLIMGLLFIISWASTRKISRIEISGKQAAMEAIVDLIRSQLRDMMGGDPDEYLPFLGSIFLFITTSNLLAIIPVYEPPTGSLTTTAALALIVFISVPFYGIKEKGVTGYLRHYIKPTPVMLPFNIISELSRTLALAVRLFGNIMSGTLIVGVLLSIAPFFVPVIMQFLGLIIGLIQAYIFSALAAIYISSAIQARKKQEQKQEQKQQQNKEIQNG